MRKTKQMIALKYYLSGGSWDDFEYDLGKAINNYHKGKTIYWSKTPSVETCNYFERKAKEAIRRPRKRKK